MKAYIDNLISGDMVTKDGIDIIYPSKVSGGIIISVLSCAVEIKQQRLDLRVSENDILDYYVKLGIVSIIDWPYVQAQISAYKDCIEKYRSESQWIGFIDIDEFIVPIKYNNIFDFLK